MFRNRAAKITNAPVVLITEIKLNRKQETVQSDLKLVALKRTHLTHSLMCFYASLSCC
jgi:hypothetical protein